jgi:TATA-binding protein-associated factor Taf7
LHGKLDLEEMEAAARAGLAGKREDGPASKKRGSSELEALAGGEAEEEQDEEEEGDDEDEEEDEKDEAEKEKAVRASYMRFTRSLEKASTPPDVACNPELAPVILCILRWLQRRRKHTPATLCANLFRQLR